MMNIQSADNTLYTQKVTARYLSFAVAFVLALVCFLVMPTTQLFAADAPVEETICVSSEDITQPVDANEQSCEITLATEDVVVIETPDSPITIDEPNMPKLMMELFMPLASR